MKHIIIFHDAFANPTDYWYPQVQSILPAGYSVITPELPNGAQQGFTFWLKSLDQYKDVVNEETIIISHGISSLLVLRFLELHEKSIRMYISVAGCANVPAHKALAPIAETFLETPINWEIIKRKIKQPVHIWNAKDPFVNPELSSRFLELLPGKKQQLSGTEHFTETQEPELFTIFQSLFEDITVQDKERSFLASQQAEQDQKEALAKSSIPSVITYDTDVAQSIAGYQGKVISELLAEARAREAEKKSASPKNPKNILYMVGSIIFTLAGIIGLGYAIISKIPETVPLLRTDTTKYASNLLRVETIQPFELTSVESFKLKDKLKEIQAGEVGVKTFSAIVPLQQGARTTLQLFIETFGIKFPTGFASQADEFIYGYYQPASGTKTPFLLIRFEGYDMMYQLIRKWEPDIIGGMQLLFWPEETSTTLIKEEAPEFFDRIINNIPMRVGTTESGKTISYGFLTDGTLLITPSAEIAEPLLRRMIGR
jgi:predicted alpha/beta hydrolase family esterase